MNFTALETPALILDIDRLKLNTRKMTEHCAAKGVTLRPHLKTSKSVEVAKLAADGRMGTVTVSTLQEAEYFAKAGFDDILYAVGITPNKFDRVERIQSETGKSIVLSVDSIAMAQAIVARGLNCPVLVEVDCGEHRGGIDCDDADVVEIAKALGENFKGIMSHAGHSYSTDKIEVVREIAAREVGAAVQAAEHVRAAGIAVETVSIGSTPTVLHAESLEGITEVRAGIYMVWDLCQYGRKMCNLDDLALTVLATVVGHNRKAGVLTVDAGALAMSKDIGSQTFLPDAGFGWLCDVDTLEPHNLSIGGVHQEHGTVHVNSPDDFERLPIGSMVRILPGHACLTAAAGHGRFHVTNGEIWDRCDGWV